MKAIEKLAAEHDALSANYDALLKLLHEVAVGRVGWQCVEVDLQARTWRVNEPAALPALSVSRRTLIDSGVIPRGGEPELSLAEQVALHVADAESNGDAE